MTFEKLIFKIRRKISFIIDPRLRFLRRHNRKCLKRDLKQAKDTGLFLTVNILNDKCCEQCSKNESKNLSFDEILKRKPLPYKNCERERGCICCYTFDTIRDDKGRLIRRE